MKLFPALALGLMMTASAMAGERLTVQPIGLCNKCEPTCCAPAQCCEPSCCAPAECCEPSCCAPAECCEPSCCAPAACCEPTCCAPAAPACCAPAEPSCCAPAECCEPSCAAPSDCCGSSHSCGCCKPRKKSLCEKIMDLERRKNKWLLGLVGWDD